LDILAANKSHSSYYASETFLASSWACLHNIQQTNKL